MALALIVASTLTGCRADRWPMLAGSRLPALRVAAGKTVGTSYGITPSPIHSATSHKHTSTNYAQNIKKESDYENR